VRKRPALLALLAVIVVGALASGCRDSGDGKEVLAAADVSQAFAQQGLDLTAYEVAGRIPALGYPVDAVEDGAAMRIACLIFSDSVTARVYVKGIRDKRPGNVSQALRAKNVAVLLDPAATADDVQRTLRAVTELQRG
jgi:hypothetical protein